MHTWGRRDGKVLLKQLGIPELDALLRAAAHVDVKGIDSEVPLRHFVAGALGWQPAWMRAMYRIRPLLARLLKLRSPEVPAHRAIAPQDVPFSPGQEIWFFRVVEGLEDRYLLMETADRHLSATLAVLVDSRAQRRLLTATIVCYHHWSGPLYFNLIRPLHHLIVRSIVRAGAS